MNVTIRTHHAAPEAGLDELAEKKLSKLDRLLPRLAEVIVEIEHEETRAAGDRFEVSLTAHAGKTVLRARERGADQRTALEAAADALTLQARREHDRKNERFHAHGAKEAVAEKINEAPPPKEPSDSSD